jgi:FkbM family methyltransferase
LAKLPPPIKRPLRRLAVWVQVTVFRQPHAWWDLIDLARRAQPAAILDIGAYVGEASVEFARACSNVPVYAFEPTPATIAVLRQRTRAWRNITIVPGALSDKTGTAEFFLNVNDQTNSLLDNAEDHRMLMPVPTRHVRRVTVSTFRLDDWLAEHVPDGPIVLKADVQGAERMLIDGGRDALARRVAAILTEASIGSLYDHAADFFEIHERLTKQLPFVLYQLYPSARLGRRAMWTEATWINPKLV